MQVTSLMGKGALVTASTSLKMLKVCGGEGSFSRLLCVCCRRRMCGVSACSWTSMFWPTAPPSQWLNKDQSNLIKTESLIDAADCWITSHFFRQSEAIIACFGWRFDPKWPLPLGSKTPSNTVSLDPAKCTCQMASKSVEGFQQGARM